MKINRIEQQAAAYQIRHTREIGQQQTDQRERETIVDTTRVTATRVARNIQLDSDKGRKIDIDC